MPNWVHEVTEPRGTAGWPEHPARTALTSITPVITWITCDTWVLITTQSRPRPGGRQRREVAGAGTVSAADTVLTRAMAYNHLRSDRSPDRQGGQMSNATIKVGGPLTFRIGSTADSNLAA